MNINRLEGLPSRLSNAAAGVLAERLGPGPTRVRALVDGRTVVMLFNDGLTKGELMQIRQGNAHHVLATRRELQRVIRDELVAVVEDLSSRCVTAFLADTHLDPDVGIIVFLLASDPPRQPPGASLDGTYPLAPRRRLREVPPRVA